MKCIHLLTFHYPSLLLFYKKSASNAAQIPWTPLEEKNFCLKILNISSQIRQKLLKFQEKVLTSQKDSLGDYLYKFIAPLRH